MLDFPKEGTTEGTIAEKKEIVFENVHEWAEKWEEEAKEWEKHQKKGLTECGVAGISSRFCKPPRGGRRQSK